MEKRALTVNETEEDEVSQANNDRQLLDITTLDGYEYSGREHDRRYGEPE